jgi:dTDP-4-dehydrorhamnose reductase
LRLLPELAVVVAPERSELDLLDEDQIVKAVRAVRPHLIINAAAYTAVDAAEKDEVSAHAVNAQAPAILADQARHLGSTLIHFSTDYVFDGRKEMPYLDSDPVNPLNAYGRTKLAGEEAIRRSGAAYLIFRTSWVYATRGKNFLLSILRLATQQRELRIVSDQTGSPTCARNIASTTCKILADIAARNPRRFLLEDVGGIYHMTAGGQTTWCGFAKEILDQARASSSDLPWVTTATAGRPLIVDRILPIKTAEYASPTIRPAYSVLSNARLFQIFGAVLPTWSEQLRDCFISSSFSDASTLLERHSQ